ncbi:MAG TPA: substrate-binding domain-containing protein, partial [Anaeromyxobacter sp.]|nr:substrate-binding domain-containing protein [Anaeromyxobacter sp.]
VDNKADTDKVLFHSGVDNVEIGRMAARYVIEKLGNKGSVIELEGVPGWNVSVERKAGFDEVIKKSGVKILASQTAYFDRDQGKQVMSSLMKQYPEFDAVFAANDDMVVGAIDAMSAVDVDPASKVTIGVDGSPVALASIRIGKLGATIDQVPDKQARQAVDWLVRYLQKKAMPPQKVMFVAPELLTRDHQ